MYTTVTFKTTKSLHASAKKTARKLGIPLTTVFNSMLGQFVRDQVITLAAERPLQSKIDEWNRESDEMDAHPEQNMSFDTVEALFAHLDEIRGTSTKTGRTSPAA